MGGEWFWLPVAGGQEVDPESMERGDNSGVRIRAATVGDQRAVCDLIFPILRAYGFAPCLGTTDRDLADMDGHYLGGGGYFAVLEEGGRIVGTVALTDLGGGVCELRRMYLETVWRGRGLGFMLLEHAIAVARARGFRRVVLETAAVLVEAIAFYQKAGFRPLAGMPLAAPCDQAFFLDLPSA